MTALPGGCITLEDHATFSSLGDEQSAYTNIWKTFSAVQERLRDHEHGRLADMDAGHVDIQIMSHLTGIANWRDPSACRAVNDEMAAAIDKHPDLLKGFATLNMIDPKSAALELERSVTELGLLGAMIDNHLPDGTHFDAERFWAVFAMAEKLDVPIYLHPAPPTPDSMTSRFNGNYADVFATALGSGAWGWHENEGLHALKLYRAGVFHRFPNLKIIIGHIMGELLPMMVDRVSETAFFRDSPLGSFRDVWEKNIWVTTSGVFTVRTLEMLLKVMPVERVMYSVDTPFSDSAKGWKFVEEVARSGVLSEVELKGFMGGNARRLLKF